MLNQSSCSTHNVSLVLQGDAKDNIILSSDRMTFKIKVHMIM